MKYSANSLLSILKKIDKKLNFLFFSRKIDFFRVFSYISLSTIMISSCSLTPEKEVIKLDYDIKKEFNNSENYKKTWENQGEWWSKFDDSILNSLIKKGVENNLDLKNAIFNINILKAQFTISEAKKYPTVTSSASGTISRSPQIATSVGPNGVTTSYEPTVKDVYSLQVGSTFELDIFDKYGALERAALYNLESSEQDFKQAQLSLISNIITSYFEVYSTELNINLTNQIINIFEEELSLENRKYELGIGTVFNIESLKQNIENYKSNIQQLEQQKKLRKYALKVLIGEYPEDFIFSFEKFQKKSVKIDSDNSDKNLPSKNNENIDENIDSNYLSLENKILKLEDVSIGVPSELLKNRYDIKSAEKKMDAAREQIGYSKADQYPSISLNAVVGFLNITDVANFFNTDYLTLSGGANINYSIFSAGTKEAALKQNVERYKQSIVNYKKIVLNAFLEVETALVKIDLLKKQREHIKTSLKHAQNSYNEAEKRYVGGIGEYKTVIDLKKSIFSIKSTIITIDKSILLAYLELYKALNI
ncbi:TolC family protein [bacterium]|nr:TolC family protein [bacterium]